MRFYATTVLSLIAALPLTAQSADFTLKGVELGRSVPPTIRTGDTTVAGVRADLSWMTNDIGGVEAIVATFAPADFAQVQAALVSKFGKPTKIFHTALTNGFGARYDQEMDQWVNERGDEMVAANYMTASNGVIQITSKKRLDATAAKVAKAKNDL